jgi:hypothetical protein
LAALPDTEELFQVGPVARFDDAGLPPACDGGRGHLHGASEGGRAAGGVKGMYDWVRKDPKNEYAFYVHIWPKLLGAETGDAAVERLAQRPVINRIECVIVDPRDDYRATVIE